MAVHPGVQAVDKGTAGLKAAATLQYSAATM